MGGANVGGEAANPLVTLHNVKKIICQGGPRIDIKNPLPEKRVIIRGARREALLGRGLKEIGND